MKEKIFALAGSFAMKPGTVKGVTLYDYDAESGELQELEHILPEVNAGQQCVNERTGIIYITNECRDASGGLGSGGEVLALAADGEQGKVIVTDRLSTCLPQPSYLCLDKTGRYLIVPHHVSDAYVTKLTGSAGRGFGSQAVYDDAGVALIRLARDGSFEKICDMAICPGRMRAGKYQIPHLHSAVLSPDSNFILVCDKGTDRIYKFLIDYRQERLVPAGETAVDDGCAPRYLCFHTQKKLLYQNNERSAFLHTFSYETPSTGPEPAAVSSSDTRAREGMKLLNKVSLLVERKEAEQWNAEGPADLLLHPVREVLYVSVRSANLITVLFLNEQGIPLLQQNISCGGENPRGLCLSLDGRFLFAMNRDTANIAKFRILTDGTLEDTGVRTPANLPGNMSFFLVAASKK